MIKTTPARIIQVILSAIVLFTVWLMFKITIPYFSFRYDIGFLLTKQAILHKAIWRWSFYIHIASSIFVLLFGIFQFIKPLLESFPKLHKLLGKAYVFIILFLSAPSGLVMAFYANGGIYAKISFVLISLLWWLFTFVAFLKIRDRKIKGHIDFMVRSYALTLSAITLRTYVLILPIFIHLHAKEMYTLVAWLSWVPNLIIAEVIIHFKVFK
ncbi:MAG: DUF2306 domain-containing protein [Sporocytophaga sp.]|uniref:DUF2306 domain-containing protein n=1 Tax=Sporocytophaga sp. TaxID=2231183 RepID=UPI001B0AC48F|nr:DUF2306 domain-containing protein [Sporocytophaga sp.]MBO9698681.1 DUF2306 domain-containing protein [Sporocytophaga sp.]